MRRSACAQTLRDALQKCTGQEIEEFLQELSSEELTFLEYDWQVWARDDQLPPISDATQDWTTWVILGGRGAGKTRAGAEWIRAQALGIAPLAKAPCARIALVGETMADVRSVMVEGISGVLAVHPNYERPVYEPSKRQLTWKNGAVAQIFSAEDPESLRGPQFHVAWCDELAKWRQGQETWDMLQFALRLGQSPRQVVTTTPRAVPLVQDLLKNTQALISRMKTEENAAHLAPNFLNMIVKRYQNTRLGRQELEGEILQDRPDALWQRDALEINRVTKPPALKRIIVAVDPPVTGHKTSDACGIIVAGLDANDRAYVLDDASIEQAKPMVWARAVVRAFHVHEADRLIVEVNQGGDLVENIIRQIDPVLPIKQVRASRGKWLRAEPVAALYEQGRVIHAGFFKQLEDQMCDFGRDGLSGGRSPDRLDALVWAISELLFGERQVPHIRVL